MSPWHLLEPIVVAGLVGGLYLMPILIGWAHEQIERERRELAEFEKVRRDQP